MSLGRAAALDKPRQRVMTRRMSVECIFDLKFKGLVEEREWEESSDLLMILEWTVVSAYLNTTP